MYKLDELFNEMSTRGMKIPQTTEKIQIPNAEQIFKQYFSFIVNKQGKQFLFREEYNPVIEWLSDNKGKGLFIQGDCGMGKTIIGRYVVPMILLNFRRLIVTCYDSTYMAKNPDEVLAKRLISIDDVGTEWKPNDFGNKRIPFAELMDSVEKNGKLIIVTTNLNADELRNLYGRRTLDRIRETCKRVVFVGDSMRGDGLKTEKE
jgi:DNA replication protein DnaC